MAAAAEPAGKVGAEPATGGGPRVAPAWKQREGRVILLMEDVQCFALLAYNVLHYLLSTP